jgi:hypothetical protein
MVTLYLSMSGVALCAVLYLVGAKWRNQVRQFAKPMFALFPVPLVLLVILLIGGEHTFPWLSFLASHGESEFYMPGWYTLPLLATREVVGILFIMWLFSTFLKLQDAADRSREDMARFHKIACWVPFFFVLYCTMVAWDFEMTLKPEWHSAIYGMQNMVSNFGMFLSFLMILIYVLNTREALVKKVETFVYNYMAQMMLAFTLLWMYTFFAQYLTIWYGNLGDERDRIDAMQDGDYSALWWTMVACKFVIPFISLCLPVTRHNPQLTVAVAVSIIVGTLCERYVWVAGVYGVGTIPVLTAVVAAGVLAAIGYTLVRGAMRRNELIKG